MQGHGQFGCKSTCAYACARCAHITLFYRVIKSKMDFFFFVHLQQVRSTKVQVCLCKMASASIFIDWIRRCYCCSTMYLCRVFLFHIEMQMVFSIANFVVFSFVLSFLRSFAPLTCNKYPLFMSNSFCKVHLKRIEKYQKLKEDKIFFEDS